MAASDLDIERELKHLPLETTSLLGRADTTRIVSRWQIVALAVNGVIGSGIYLLPASTAARAEASMSPWMSAGR